MEAQKLNSNYVNINEARKLRAQMKKSATKFYLLNKILLNKQQKNIQKMEAQLMADMNKPQPKKKGKKKKEEC